MVWNSARTTFCALLGVLALTTTAPTTAQAANPPCPDFPPVLSLQLVGIYTDARQSVPDAAAEKKNSDLTAGVDQFLRSNEQVLARPAQARQEIPGDWAIACRSASERICSMRIGPGVDARMRACPIRPLAVTRSMLPRF